MILNSKFDVQRGWPRMGAIDETFKVRFVAGAPVILPAGTVVSQQLDGTVDRATSPLPTADPDEVWVVVSGNDDFDGRFLDSVVCARSNIEARLDPSNFVPGAYVPKSLLSFANGQFVLATSGQQVIGSVISNDIATDTTIRIFYDGGKARKV
jgi:hypothetical protein